MDFVMKTENLSRQIDNDIMKDRSSTYILKKLKE